MDELRLRIADAERDAAAADLREHYALGRITTEEHADRLDRIWAARTRGDLAPVFADLPSLRPSPRPTSAASLARRRPGPPRAAFLLVGLVALVALSAATHLPFILLGVVGLVVFAAARRRREACGARLDQVRRPAQ